jgi:hypothetical protein
MCSPIPKANGPPTQPVAWLVSAYVLAPAFGPAAACNLVNKLASVAPPPLQPRSAPHAGTCPGDAGDAG